MMDDVISFLEARMGEAGTFAMAARMPHAHRENLLRDVAARRSVVRRCAARVNEMDRHSNGLVSPRALLARQVLLDLAGAWGAHPDYDPEWQM